MPQYIFPFLAFLSATFYPAYGISLQKADTAVANYYFHVGDSLLEYYKFDSAKAYLEKALPIYEKAQAWEDVAACYNKLGDYYWEEEDAENLFLVADKALQVVRNKMKEETTEVVNAYYNRGRAFRLKRDYEKALKEYQEALSYCSRPSKDQHVAVAKSLDNIGLLYSGKGNYKTALEYYQQAIDTIKKDSKQDALLADFYGHLGAANNRLANYETALSNYNVSISIYKTRYGKDFIALSNLYIDIGGVCFLKKEYEQALKYNQESLLVGRKNSINLMDVSSRLGAIATVLDNLGDYEQALEYFRESLIAFEQSEKRANYNIAVIYINMGTCFYNVKKLDASIDCFRKALDIVRKLYGSKHYYFPIIHSNLGNVYQKQGLFALALSYQQKALKMNIELFGSGRRETAYILDNLGGVYEEMGELDKAFDCYKRSIDIELQIFGRKSTDVAYMYNKFAGLAVKHHNYSEALENYQQAIISNVLSFNDSSIYTNPAVREYFDQNILLETFEAKSRIFRNLYLRTGDLQYLKASLQTYQVSDTLIDRIRQSHLYHSDKIKLGENSSKVYEGAIETSLLLYRSTHVREFLEQAFYFCEKSKAGALTDALSDVSAKSFGMIPDKLLELEKELKIDKSFYQSEIQQNKMTKDGYDTTVVHNLENQLFTTNRRYDSLVLALEKNYPEYYQLKYRNQVAKVSELQQKIDKESALVEYFTGDSSSWVFLVTREDFKCFEIKDRDSLEYRVAALREALKPANAVASPDQTYRQFTRESYQLFASYLSQSFPYLKSKKKLIIVPDGQLGYIPFDLLLTKEVHKDKIDFKSLPYLLNSYQTSYGYSASLVFEAVQPLKKQSPNHQFLAFAPEYANNAMDSTNLAALGRFRDEVTSLAWNGPEVKNINKYLEGISITGKEAVESKFKELADKYSIIHLAMHALIDDKDPMNSKLVFSQAKDSVEDGLLNAYELYNMELPAELVVLSACETGYGKFEKGEGIMSLARAFTYAGCPSVVMSHWVVDDEATSRLMELFYKNLSEGKTKDEALQRAKLDYLRTADAIKQHPAFWGSFVVMGDTTPVATSTFLGKYWMYLLLLISATTIAALFIYRRAA